VRTSWAEEDTICGPSNPHARFDEGRVPCRSAGSLPLLFYRHVLTQGLSRVAHDTS
jgi:hypothetical protein